MSQTTPATLSVFASPFGALGRLVRRGLPLLGRFLSRTGGVWLLFVEALRQCRFSGKMRGLVFPVMMNVGARSLPIVAIVALLVGAILVLQTGDVFEDFGQIDQAPGVVALSMTRALGPLMTAIVLIARVGASFTAVLGSMNINEEVTALRTMAIHPIGYLVTPRVLSMLVMAPCLVVFSYLVGSIGGGLVAYAQYGITPAAYTATTFDYLEFSDVFGGLLKAFVFGGLIGVISCYYGLNTSGGPTGLGRNIMVSVVTSLVVVVVADAILTAFLVNYVL